MFLCYQYERENIMTHLKHTHTPGPWVFDWGMKINGVTKDYIVGPVDSYNDILTVAIIKNVNEESEANARLIAAAPELLEVLEAAKAHMEDPYPAGDDLSHILTRADAAIAKARGQL